MLGVFPEPREGQELDVVVDSRWVQGFPPLMPRQVEVRLEQEASRALMEAAARKELYARLDSPEGERIRVRDLWINPHDAQKITLILES